MMTGTSAWVARSASCPVMIGRDLELETLKDSWRSTGQLLVVQGPAGIGKSRLVREFASQVKESGELRADGPM